MEAFMFDFIVLLVIIYFCYRFYKKRKQNNNKKPAQKKATTTRNTTIKTESSERDFKGDRLNTFVDDFTIIDLETTGFSPKNDKIIELAGVKVRNNKIVDTYTTLVNPQVHISSRITKVTHIDDNMVADCPTIENLINEFLTFIGDDIVVAHNAHFDINFLYDNSMRTLKKPFANDFIDTLYIARKKLPDLDHHKLENLAEHYNITQENAHRALADCETTFEIYQRLRQ